jgi:hypothetical protein
MQFPMATVKKNVLYMRVFVNFVKEIYTIQLSLDLTVFIKK